MLHNYNYHTMLHIISFIFMNQNLNHSVHPINQITITGKLIFDPLYWEVYNRNNEKAYVVHLEILNDPKNERFQVLPVHVYKNCIKEFLLKNIALNGELVRVQGSLGIGVKNALRYDNLVGCLVILKKEEDTLDPLTNVQSNLSIE